MQIFRSLHWPAILLLSLLLFAALDSSFARRYMHRCQKVSVYRSITVANCQIMAYSTPVLASTTKLKAFVEPLVCWLPDQIEKSFKKASTAAPSSGMLLFSRLMDKYYMEFSFLLQHQLALNALKCSLAGNNSIELEAEFMPVVGIDLISSNRPRGIAFSDVRLLQNGAIATFKMFCDDHVRCIEVWQQIQHDPNQLQDLLEFRLTVLTNPECYKTSVITKKLIPTNGQLLNDAALRKCWRLTGMECSTGAGEDSEAAVTEESAAAAAASVAYYNFRRSCKNLAIGSGGQPRPFFLPTASREYGARSDEEANLRIDDRGMVLQANSSAMIQLNGLQLAQLKSGAVSVALAIEYIHDRTAPIVTIGSCGKENNFTISISHNTSKVTLGWQSKGGKLYTSTSRVPIDASTSSSMVSYQIVLNQSRLETMLINSQPLNLSTSWMSDITDAFDERPACVRFSAATEAKTTIGCMAVALGSALVHC